MRESTINAVGANASTHAQHRMLLTTMMMMKNHDTSNVAADIEKKMITTSRDGLGQPMFSFCCPET